jgi:AcrR family transcriptional regulator
MRKVPAQIASKLHSAIPLIAEQGLEHTKIDEIADTTGIPKATLYYYFSGKEEILAFLIEDMLTAIADEATIAMQDGETAADRLEAVVATLIRLLVENHELSAALVGDLGRVTRMPALVDSLIAAFYAPVENLLNEGAADGSLRTTPNPMLASLAICGAITGSVLMAAVLPPDSDEVPDNVGPDLINVVMKGLLPAGVER